METNGGFTITTNTTTNEEVTVNTTTDDVILLRDQIESLKEIVMGLASAVADKQVEDEVESHDSDTSGDESVPETVTLSYDVGGPDPHGIIPSVVEAIRPDAPVEPEPEPEPEPTVDANVGDADADTYPKSINGVRPSQDVSLYQPSRWSARRGDHTVAKGLGEYIKWAAARGDNRVGMVIDSPHPSLSLLDWIAFTSGRRMTKPQARTALLRMESNGHVKRVGKSGKQDLWTIDPNGGYTAYLS
jgi:hypothetical protein